MKIGKSFVIAALGIVLLGYFIISYNSLVESSQQVTASWAQVQNTYQRRLDLIPNLVNTVKGYAGHERDTLIAITQARSQAYAAQNKLSENVPSPQELQQLEQAQANLGSALGRLMVIVERYPDLKANQNFLALQAELAGSENRISVERRRYNEAVQNYNIRVQRFPGLLMAKIFGFKPQAYFQADNKAQRVPEVKFN